MKGYDIDFTVSYKINMSGQNQGIFRCLRTAARNSDPHAFLLARLIPFLAISCRRKSEQLVLKNCQNILSQNENVELSTQLNDEKNSNMSKK